ncbi:uncharacterized protein LOC127452163 isoform X4 [Myxocyprinus asiaticus]|uniref:uncharacterized protein LOC127452163 isoform X4 n=1 Tax=Myxocyprinus asiaticus TaxID=70543 RepID=UPI002221C9BA|nr:uncharacterized protein LOC127452163 isoform X4 [Myxocyprinus asiaticus]
MFIKEESEDMGYPEACRIKTEHTEEQTGQLTNFLEELDVLLSSLPEDGRPLVVLGDFNIHQDKPQATELNNLLASFDLEKLHTTATHRSGNQLDLIFTRNCTNSNILVTPLHVSTFNMTLPSTLKQTPPLVSFRRNLRSLSPSRLSTIVSTSLPTQNVFTMLDVNTATDTLSSTLTTCLDNICPISSRPARATPPSPWQSDVLREHRTDLRAAERRWRKSKDPADLGTFPTTFKQARVTPLLKKPALNPTQIERHHSDCSNFCLPGGHLGLDEGAPPATQPSQD